MNINQPSVTFACEECGRQITLPANRAGHVDDCPHCHEFVDVPSVSEAACAVDEAADRPCDAHSKAANGRTNGQLWCEVLAVLCLGYFPYLVSALMHEGQGSRHTSFVEHALALVVAAMQIAIPLLLIMSLSNDGWSVFGIVRPRWILDGLLAIAICCLGRIGRNTTLSLVPEWLYRSLANGHHAPGLRPSGVLEYTLMTVMLLIAGASEELMMRGYLIPRLERLLRSTWLAVVLTSAMFASYHLYQGVLAAIGHFGFGLVFAVAFCLTRRIWPLCLAHAMTNFSLYW